jgi:hypothetical protein
MQSPFELSRELRIFQLNNYFSLYQADKEKRGCGSNKPGQSMPFATAVLDTAKPRH